MEPEEDTWQRTEFTLDEFIWDADRETLTYKKVVRLGSLPSYFEVQGRVHKVKFGEITNDEPNELCRYKVIACDKPDKLKDLKLIHIIAIMPWKQVQG